MATNPSLASTLLDDNANCQRAIQSQFTLNPHNLSVDGVELDIGWGSDGGFLSGCEVSMTSVALHNSTLHLHFHLFTNDSQLLDADKLQQLAKQRQLIITVYQLDNAYFSQLPTSRLWSSAIYYRFVIAQYLSTLSHRMLYLDADVVCQGSLAELVTFSMGEAVVAAVAERQSDWWQKQAQILGCAGLANGYFNSGVMLINLRQWRAEQVLSRLLTLAADPEMQPKLKFFDQDLLNVVLVDKKIFLDPAYNSQYSLNYELNKTKRHSLDPHSIIIHFIGPSKPWHVWAQYPNAAAYQTAKANSPWRNDPLHLPQASYQFRYCYKHWFRQRHVAQGGRYFVLYLLRKLLAWRYK